jgi:hypothetical protein
MTAPIDRRMPNASLTDTNPAAVRTLPRRGRIRVHVGVEDRANPRGCIHPQGAARSIVKRTPQMTPASPFLFTAENNGLDLK